MEPQRLVIVAPNWLGDAVMALPLIADICRGWPDTHVTVAARGAVTALFRMIDEVNDVLTLEGGGGLGAIRAAAGNARALHRGEFDAALLLPNSFLSAWTASRAGIPERWGYRTDWRGRLLTKAIPRPGTHLHQAQYYQALGPAIGVPAGPLFAHLNVSAEGRARARVLLAEAGLPAGRPFVAMAPGAAYGRAKQWLPERFAELAAIIGRERDTATVLVGTAADTAVCREIAAQGAAAGACMVDLSGRTDLEALASVLALARAVVANDSGAMHLAAAVGTKVIAVFGATNESKTAPLAAGAGAPAATVVATPVWCRPCMLRECPIDHRCMTGITAPLVYEAYETSRISRS